MPPNKTEQFELAMTEDPRGGWTSASNALADTLCVGRHLAQRGLPDIPCTPAEQEARDHGTAVHAALAKRDPDGLTEAGHQTYDRCIEIETIAVKQFFGDEIEDLLEVAEERFWVQLAIDPKDPNPNTPKVKHSAQVDRVYRSKTKALVIEYKTLPGDHAAASSNEQARDEVCLVAGNLMTSLVGAVVIQPLITMKPEICTYDAGQIKVANALMFDRVRASNKVGSPRTAGGVQCTYCKAKFQCAEYIRFSAEQVPVMQSFVDSPIATWTNEQCGVFLERYATATKWLEATLQFIRRKVEAGELPGWGIGQGDRKFEVTDMTALFNRAMQLGIPEADFMNLCSVHKEGLTKLVRAITSTKGKALQAEVDKLFQGICADERKRGSIERVQQPKQVKE